MRLIGKYYFTKKGKTFRAFSLGMAADGTIVLERRHPEKDSHLSRKRGVRYILSKEKFAPTWKDNVEHLGSAIIEEPLAPCRKEETDSERTINLPDKNGRIVVHVFVVKHGNEKEFENYNLHEGVVAGKNLENKITPKIGVIVTVI
jgi:hypothetical protein